MLEGEHLPGPAEARLDLVDDQQRAFGTQGLGGEPEVVVGRDDGAALPEDRLDDEGGDVAAAEGLAQRVRIAEGDAGHFGNERAEAIARGVAPLEAEGAEGGAVVGAVAGDDAAPAGGGAGELDRGLDRLAAAGAEEDAMRSVGHQGGQPLGGQARQAGALDLREAGGVVFESRLPGGL